MREVLGDRHEFALNSIANFADLLREQGRLDEALATLGDVTAVAREVLGAQHARTLKIEAIAARLAHARGEGTAALMAAVERMEAVLGAEHQQTRKYAAALAEL